MSLRFCFILLTATISVFGQYQRQVQVDSSQYFKQLAIYYARANNYKDALDCAKKGADYAKKNNLVLAEANAFAQLGTFYIDLNKYDDAIDALNKSTALYSKMRPSSEHAFACYHLGRSYIEKKNYIEAEKYLNYATTLYNKLGTPEASVVINLQKAIVEKAKDNKETAIQILNNIIAIPDSEDLYKVKPEALYHVALLELEQNRSNLALNYLQRSLNSIQGTEKIRLQSDIYQAMSRIYESIADSKNAYVNLKKYINLKDSIGHIAVDRIGVDDFIKFKESDRLQDLEEMQRDIDRQKDINQFAKVIAVLAIALISILSLLSLTLYKNNLIRKETNNLLQEKNLELEHAKSKAEKASKARDEFLSTVSHELRTPLNAINGITHLLLEENPSESQLQYLHSLQFSGNYLLTFINEILEMNRIESSNIEAEAINFNLKTLLRNINNSLKELAHGNNNKFVVDISENIPDTLVGDQIKLSQILINLINNALKFTKDGEVHVTTSVTEKTDENVSIVFRIIDTGIGIPEDKQESIFDSFSQGSIEINRKYGGTGLGLNIVRRLTEILGGTITLDSQLGRGSTFTLSLSFKIGVDFEKVEAPVSYDESIFINKKILLIEDNKINQMITKKLLEKKQFIVEVTDNGEDAIVAVKNNYYDLVLMDVHLPGINGTIATQTIRTFDKRTRIIALTAISLEENRESLLSFGMNDVLTKPFEPQKFYEVLAKHL